MRSKYALKNAVLSLMIFAVNGAMSMVIRAVMLPVLGSEIVGLTATFSDILAFLNLADMGISSAVGASLYAPIHNREYPRIRGMLLLLRKMYRLCGCIFVAMMLAATVILRFAFRAPHISGTQAALYFFLTAAGIGLSYFFSYRLILISTDQRMFRLKIVNVLTKTISGALQIAVLLLFKSFALYLIVIAVFNLLYFLLINALIRASYPRVERARPQLAGEDKNRIFRMIKGYFFHQTASFAVFGTNNLYTAIFSGLTSAALLSNYQMLITMMNGVIGNIFSGITSSIGDLVSVEKPEKSYQVFRVIFYLTCGVVITATVTFINSAQALVGLWVGPKYLVSMPVVYLLGAYFFVNSIRPAAEQFKSAAGIFYEDRFVPIPEILVNVLACVTLGYKFGMAGVVAGNLISTIAIISWQKPYIIFKYIFKTRLAYYFRDLALYTGVGLCCLALTGALCSRLTMPNLYLRFAVQALVSMAVCAGAWILVFFRTKPFRGTVDYVRQVLGKAT